MAKQPVVTEYTIINDRIRSDIRIALISDLHERRSLDIVNILKEQQPDLIAVAGDTFERYNAERFKPNIRKRKNPLRKIIITIVYYINYILMKLFGKKNMPNKQYSYQYLRQASTIAPVFMSLGNHEETLNEEDYQLIKQYGIHLLDNDDYETAVRNNFMIIGGLSSDYDEAWLYRFSKKDGFRLLLCHEPELYEDLAKDMKFDLVLSGHNHGGQVRIFGRGLVSSGGKLFPKYHRGVFDNRLVVSAGCSNTASIPRWGNPREVVMITLTNKKEKIEKSA